MVFDIGAGLYWRLEEGGLLFGWSNPDEAPGEARSIDWAFYDAMRARLGRPGPGHCATSGLRQIWAATIDYTPDHLPILGPALDADGTPIEGVTVASAGGHGMMWGPGVARVAADLAVHGRTDAHRRRRISASTGSTPRAAAASPPTRSRCRSRSSRRRGPEAASTAEASTAPPGGLCSSRTNRAWYARGTSRGSSG